MVEEVPPTDPSMGSYRWDGRMEKGASSLGGSATVSEVAVGRNRCLLMRLASRRDRAAGVPRGRLRGVPWGFCRLCVWGGVGLSLPSMD